MNEQAKGLSQGEPKAQGLPRLPVPLVLMTGGKGGVGKSSLALNLAVDLAKRGRRVLLVDLDLALANLAVMLKLRPKHNLEDYLEGRVGLTDCITSIGEGIDLLAAGSGSLELARPDSARRARIFDGLAEVAQDYDMLVADTAAGIGPDVLAFAAAADFVLAVTTPDPASVADAYGIIKALDHWSTERGVEVPTPALVLNRVSGASEAQTLAARLAMVTRRFLSRSPRLAGWIPESRSVRAGTRAQRSFVETEPHSLAAQCVGRLASRVEALVGAGGHSRFPSLSN